MCNDWISGSVSIITFWFVPKCLLVMRTLVDKQTKIKINMVDTQGT